jgi:hypothetical protein
MAFSIGVFYNIPFSFLSNYLHGGGVGCGSPINIYYGVDPTVVLVLRKGGLVRGVRTGSTIRVAFRRINTCLFTRRSTNTTFFVRPNSGFMQIFAHAPDQYLLFTNPPLGDRTPALATINLT